ncbi:MAG: carbon monoxide dehydrogenase [Candidatus Omnitrophica bacterium CG11_big_fil_rev_8_21_14_0_20_42_13]|uniref:Carbon monoxide dehydrogenase n=1 Tax=Candidatus Ghiorseimicrobium undicola TaxID=1974746 RepID=A0A2H0M032_9BACT|nr:MAG: carbon monoxide dehydrogenase [Candidatus Omnitrophica bacterium CG11_big_fil_rev_8_21_14_0_20_42_13]
MNYTIAVAGKGGTGKTTIAGLIIRYLKEIEKGSVLAIDADPNANLGQVLGIEPKENIGALIDEVSRNIDKIPAGMTKERYIEYQVQSAIEESDGLDILAMGRPEGPGCYCFANNVLRGIISKIAGDYKFVIIDNEAGLEHLSRRTTRKADYLLIVSDQTRVGLKSAARIYELVKELKIEIKEFILVVNRSLDKENNPPDEWKNISMNFDRVETIPYDEKILDSATLGEPLMKLEKTSGALQAVFKIMDKIIGGKHAARIN